MSAAPEGRELLLKEIAKWLQSKADELSRQAASRMESEKDRNATVAELKQAKKLAEKMAGRELPLASVDQKSHKAYCDMQVKIGGRLESEAKQLSAWAEVLQGYSAGKASGDAEVEELTKQLKSAEDGEEVWVGQSKHHAGNTKEQVRRKRVQHEILQKYKSEAASAAEREKRLTKALERIVHKANDPDIADIALTALSEVSAEQEPKT